MENLEESKPLCLYLDWNVITRCRNLHKLDPARREEIEKLLELLSVFEKQLTIPYSPAHLQDIKKGFLKNPTFLTSDFEILTKITSNVFLVENLEEAKPHLTIKEPSKQFEELISQNYQEETAVVDIIAVIEAQIPPDLLPFLDEVVFTKEQLTEFVNLGIVPHDVKEQITFKELLFELAKKIEVLLKLGVNSYPEARQMLLDSASKLTGLNNDEALNQLLKRDEEFALEITRDQVKKVLENTELNYQSKVFETVSLYWSIDAQGYKKEKFSQKNTGDNFFADSLHCYYASHCDIYVTGDEISHEKSTLVLKALNKKTKVFELKSIDECINFVHQLLNNK